MTDAQTASREAAKYRARLRDTEQKAEQLATENAAAKKRNAALEKKLADQENNREYDRMFEVVKARTGGHELAAASLVEESNRLKATLFDKSGNLQEEALENACASLQEALSRARLGNERFERAKIALDATRNPVTKKNSENSNGHLWQEVAQAAMRTANGRQ